MLQAKTEEQKAYIEDVILKDTSMWFCGVCDGIHIDDFVSFEEMKQIVEYLNKEESDKPFTIRWLMDNADFKKIKQIPNVEFVVEDDTADGKDAGCIDIIYCAQYYWCLSKGTWYKEWLVTASDEYRNDAWIPSVETIADFKRLFRVATGYELPIMEQNKNSV